MNLGTMAALWDSSLARFRQGAAQRSHAPCLLLFGALFVCCANSDNADGQEPASKGKRLEFKEVFSANYNAMPAVLDINRDGFAEPVGGVNRRGYLSEVSYSGSCFAEGVTPFARDNRFFWQGDSLFMLTNTYHGCAKGQPSATLCRQSNSDPFNFSDVSTMLPEEYQGFGETIVVFDYDTDADNDIFIPYYTSIDQEKNQGCRKARVHNVLLENTGDAFKDVSYEAGVTMSQWYKLLRVEGAQAVDINDDGWVDLYVGSHFFLNAGGEFFVDRREEMGLPKDFDEGLKFSDMDNDGDLDFVINTRRGPAVYESDGNNQFRLVWQSDTKPKRSYGLAIFDANFDGWLDIVVPATSSEDETLAYLNTGDFNFRKKAILRGRVGGPLTHFDYDLDGKPDLVWRSKGPEEDRRRLRVYRNETEGTSHALSVVLTGEGGARTQYGRVVRASAVGGPTEETFTRVVDGGSGYMSQSDYAVVFHLPRAGRYSVRTGIGKEVLEVELATGQKATVNLARGEVVVDRYSR